jgi:hypothetical protein
MAFGLWLFYALLPLFYGLLGAGIGYWLGLAITRNTVFDAGLLEFILALVGGALLAFAAFFLEPYRRILAGAAAGAFLGLSVAYLLGAGTFISIILAVVGGVILGILVPMVFDPLIVVVTAVNGAAMAVDGANMILNVEFLDRYNLVAGGQMVALMIWIGLAIVGFGWQSRNMAKWVPSTMSPPS